jgi:hypothetical protein
MSATYWSRDEVPPLQTKTQTVQGLSQPPGMPLRCAAPREHYGPSVQLTTSAMSGNLLGCQVQFDWALHEGRDHRLHWRGAWH